MNNHSAFSPRPYLLILATTVLLRLLTLTVPDLVDTTEGRYATTSQRMVERQDWVTPMFIRQGIEEPYTGKPPLHFWLINTSYSIFGLNNFSARLPGVFSGAAITLILFFMTRALLGSPAAYVAALTFSTSTLAFFLSGAVVLDVTLTVGITLAIAGFSLADKSKLAGYLFFAGLGLGSLVKGPAAVAFTGAALGPWVLVRGGLNPKNWPAQVKALPWATGILLMLAIILPWYLLMEVRNPGFLRYFIEEENVGRFFSKDYADKFGNGHVQPRGTAWLMLVPCVVPWSVMLIASLIEKAIKKSPKAISAREFIDRLKQDELLLLGFTWAISCPLLLTGMTQYTATYLMSCIPGFAFLMAVLWKRATERNEDGQFPSPLVTRILVFLLGLTVVITASVFKGTYEIHGIAFAIALAFGILTVIGSVAWKRARGSLPGVGVIAIMTVLVYAILFPCADIQVSKNRSTQQVMKYAEELISGAPLREIKIGFAFNLPFSARFYSAILSSPEHKFVTTQLDRDEIKDSPQHVIIVRGKGSEKELLEIDPTKQKLGQLGKWNVYRGSLK